MAADRGPEMVRQVHNVAFDHGGIKALKPKPSGGRRRESTTLAEEKADGSGDQGGGSEL
jgi:hypothetical protein